MTCPWSVFHIDADLTLQVLHGSMAHRRRLASQLCGHRGWCALLGLEEEETVATWLEVQLASLSSPTTVAALAAIPHHPSLLWGLWVPLVQLMQELQKTTMWPRLGLAGVPGQGKTTLGRALAVLGQAYGFSPIVVSIDDYYLPLPTRADAMATNPFAIDRGPPGSHDLAWLNRSLDDFAASGQCCVPRFDKGLAGGRGDRSGSEQLTGDCFLLEGWLVGAQPFEAGPEDPWPNASAVEQAWCAHCGHVLRDYTSTWERLHGLALMIPQQWRHSLRWRLQAEARQRRRGKGVLSGSQLERLLRCFWASVPPYRALHPGQIAASTPAVLMGAVPDGRRRVVDVGLAGTTGWPQLPQLSSFSSSSTLSMG